MESIDKALTSIVMSDSSDDDNNDVCYDKLSTTELVTKIKTYRNLCLGNKINISNAFDIDMIGSFYFWLEKNKHLLNMDEDDVNSFHEINDYLDASSKVYSYRVDNLSETTGNLVEEFKKMNNNTRTNEIDDDFETEKLKESKLMLTTSDKLRNKLIKDGSSVNPSLRIITSLSFKELFSIGRPYHYLKSMYYDKSLAEEIKTFNEEKNENDESFCLMEDIKNGLDQKVICPAFNNFIASHDKDVNVDDSQLEGIEYHFDFDYHGFQNNIKDLNCDKPDNTNLDYNSNNIDTTVLDGLVECIDNIDKDYSFFNPQRLVHWRGPRTWKAKTMSRALISYKSNKQKDIISNIDDDLEEITKQTKTLKNCSIVKNDALNVNWLNRSQIDELLIQSIKSKEKIKPSSLQKWYAFNNMSDTKAIVVDVKFLFELIRGIEIIPDWRKTHLNEIGKKRVKHSHKNINDCGKTIVETLEETIQINAEDTEKLINEHNAAIDNKDINDKLCNLDEPQDTLNLEDDDDVDDSEFKTKPKLNIGELKKEISDIIDEECVVTDPNSEWSTKLSFLNLLNKLRVYERDELSIPIVFVGLLHLVNEQGLKLLKLNCTINNIEDEVFIVKPMNKM